MRKLRLLGNLVRFKVRQRFQGFDVPDAPYLDPEAAVEFERLLSAAHGYLEFGSGGSTLLAARLGVPTITVESDRFYAAAVVRRLPAGARHLMLLADIGVTKEWGFPLFGRPTPRRRQLWAGYVRRPFAELGDTFPDLVLVDGRFRRACALETARQAQERGAATTLFVDDYRARSYVAIEALLGQPRLVGRAAIFTIHPSLPAVPMAAVEEAIADPR